MSSFLSTPEPSLGQRSRLAGERPDGATVVLRYRTPTGRTGLFIIAALSPIWLFWIAVVVYSLATEIASGDAAMQVRVFFALALLVIPLVSLSIWACLDNSLSIDARGIRFPVRFRPLVGFKRHLDWQDLLSVVYRPREDETRSQLLFQFRRGAVPLSIGGFAKDDLRKLVLATQTHCTQSAQPAALSFTEIWQQEYESRFAPTVFVPLEPGERLQNGRLEILAPIAAGGLSAVYLASAEGRRVAVKEAVAPSQTTAAVRDKAIELFHREARLLKTLSHPRISHVLDSFSDKDRHYLVMEYIAGVDLRTFIKENGRQHEEVALRWALEIADVLCYLHSRVPPVIHRDLTPDNLIFTADGAIAVIDFGAANAFVAQATGTLVGKQNYISPEQFRGRATPQSDIYALGCTLHFLLTGCDPEPMTQSHPRESNQSVSEVTDTLVARATALDVNDRIESAQTFLANIRGTISNLRRAGAKVGL